MEDSKKSKSELIKELSILRQYSKELEKNSKESFQKKQILTSHLQMENALAQVAKMFYSQNEIDFIFILEKIGSAIGATHSFLFLTEHDNKTFNSAFEWHNNNYPSLYKFNKEFEFSDNDWIIQKLEKNEILIINEVENLPKEAQKLKTVLKNQNAKSALAVPLFSNEKFYGFYGLTNVSEVKIWDEKSVKLLKTLGFMTSNELDRRAKTQELIENEQLFRSLTETAPTAIFIINEDYKVVFANNITCKLTGYSIEDLQNNSFIKFIHPDFKDLLEKKASERFNHNGLNRYQYKIITKGGEIKWVDYSSALINFKNEKAILGTAFDITEIKNSEEKLIESEKRFRGLYENAAVGIYRTSINGKIILANPTLVKMLGYKSYEEVKNLNVEENHIDPVERQKFLKMLDSEDHFVGLQQKWKRPDGSTLYVSESGRAIRDEAGKVKYVEGIVEDITSMILAQKKLKEQEQVYRELFKTSPNGIVIENKEGYIIEVNNSQTEITGYSKEELVGKHVSIFASPENVDNISRNIEAILSGNTLNHTVRSRKKNGEEIFIHLNESRIPLGNEFGILSITEDITKRVNYEDQLIKSKQIAENSERVKSEFLAQMSHEIRTPVNTVLSFSSLLKADMPSNIQDEFSDYFQVMDNAGRRIIRTIDLILNMSEIQAGSFEINVNEYDLFNDILTQMIKEYRLYSKEKGLQFRVKQNFTNSKVKIDHYSVSQIFDNLLNNAIKYTKKGFIELSIEEMENEKVKVSIKDSGIGMSDDYQKKIFTPFSQEEQGYSRKYEGNGLGLALVKKYCEMNKLKISVKSKQNVGTEFSIEFDLLNNN